jgi:transcription elongation factor GreA-like protein
LKEEVKKFRDLDTSIKAATITLKNLFSFAHELAVKEAESFAFKNLTRETEKDIMMNFW